VDRLPFVIALGMAAVVTAARFAWIMLRLPQRQGGGISDSAPGRRPLGA
jgi:hypothetical protein